EALQGPRPRRSNQFYEEARLPSQERSLLSDYRDSGYDRGHNVPAGDMTTERGMAQSFSMANMMPQARLNNQGIWAKRVEEATRLYAKRSTGDIYVFTGSAGSLGSIGKSKVTIPAHLYKLIYDPNKQSAWAYWVDNTNEAQVSPLISYAELKSKTGIDFHLAVQDETARPSPEASPPSIGKPKVGGWYPIFFDQFSPEKIAALNTNIAAGRVASVEVQYDRNLELAQQIERAITSTKTTPVVLTQNSPPPSNEVSYERNRVIAIVRSK
ncbi:MAG: endonuclease, partial [Polynucleobacter sp. 16-46-70]